LGYPAAGTAFDQRQVKLRRGKKQMFFSAAVIIAALFLSILYSRRYGNILADIPFSGTYLDRNGGLLHIFLTEDDKFRSKKRLADFPSAFVEGVILQEDRYFYAHPGINPAALLRAGWETYIRKTRRMGASTITMQLARLKYRLYTRSFPGKISQIAHALYLEIFHTKKDILEAYLNLAPCGRNIEGFPAAAWYYFGRPIEKLDLSQLLLLCVIPQDPNARTPQPGRIPQELLDARKKLFSAWIAAHPENRDLETELKLGIDVVCAYPFKAPHFTEYLEAGKSSPSFETVTTIDPDFQKLCEETLSRYIAQNRGFGVMNGAALLADWTSMEVLASVGSADYFDDAIQGQVNGTTAKRSPGSTLKPFIYALALDQGLIHSETLLKDTPVSFNEYTPDNFGSVFKGPVKAWDALVDSRNIPAISLARELNKPDLYDFLKYSGVTDLKEKEHYGLSIVLGSAEVNMMELVGMYALLANNGMKQNLKMTKDGRYPGKRPDRDDKILTGSSSFIVRKMLERNIPPYTSRPKTSKNTPLAFKTGTSIGFKDCWSIAIFDRFILCVWIGNFDGRGNNSFQGRTMAAPLLFNIADSLLADADGGNRLPPQEQPAGVAQIRVCAVSGGLPGSDCRETVSAWFIPGVSPITACHIHRKIFIDSRTGYRCDETEGKYIVSAIREFWPSDLLSLFAKAGLPRLVPPPYPPQDMRFDNSGQGFPPDIISPMADTDYVLRPESDSRKSLVLMASSDADSTGLFWFEGSTFIGRTKPDEKLIWMPKPGIYTLSVVDSKGRSDTIDVRVRQGE
jgi:penicillin-binding protein 1C